MFHFHWWEVGTTIFCLYSYPEIRLHQLVGSLEKDVMSGEVEWCPILHVRPKFDVFTLPVAAVKSVPIAVG